MKVGMFNSLRGGAARFAESVKKYNGDIEFVDLDCPPTLENVEKLRGCEGFLFSPFKNDGDIFWKKVSEVGVKYVATCSAGYDHFDLAAMKKYHVDAVLEGSREDYAPRGEEVFTETFRHMAREIENRKYDRYANAPGNYDKLYAYAETPAGMDGMKHDLSEILDFIDREQGFYEIVPKGYSKATAIRYITEYLNIPMEDTVAIGDSNNDLPMLQYAHTSIAMGNSSKHVLEVADYITTDVDKDGIWNALKWLGVLDK